MDANVWLAVAIPATGYAWHTFTLNAAIRVDYSYAAVDDSSQNIAIIRHADLERARAGESVTAWTVHSAVISAHDSVSLPADTYNLLIYCRNEFFDCDVQYSLSAWY